MYYYKITAPYTFPENLPEGVSLLFYIVYSENLLWYYCTSDSLIDYWEQISDDNFLRDYKAYIQSSIQQSIESQHSLYVNEIRFHFNDIVMLDKYIDMADKGNTATIFIGYEAFHKNELNNIISALWTTNQKKQFIFHKFKTELESTTNLCALQSLFESTKLKIYECEDLNYEHFSKRS